MSKDTKAFMVGSGIGSLAAAAFMIRDGEMSGSNITIFEALPVLGGSLDGGGNPETGYTMRGGRMLTTDNYECTWELFKSIPSLEHPGKSVFDETVEFNGSSGLLVAQKHGTGEQWYSIDCGLTRGTRRSDALNSKTPENAGV